MSRWIAIPVAFALALPGGCTMPEMPPPPPDTVVFGVFGDGPYRGWESARFRHVIEEANGLDLAWFLHVGDILWFPCSDDAFVDRLDRLNRIEHPVIYTPGDNEWADCHEPIAGTYDPLDRLKQLRATFFAEPGKSLGRRVMPVETQAVDTTYREFVENVRWRRGGFIFITLHIVGSDNARAPFTGRTAAHDWEVDRRVAAALAWMDDAFALAEAEDSHGVVMALHADPDFERRHRDGGAFDGFLDRLDHHVRAFPGQVVLIHGDSHIARYDHPLLDPVTGAPFENFARIETYGSPDIGWLRVSLDTVNGRVANVWPRKVPGWWLF